MFLYLKQEDSSMDPIFLASIIAFFVVMLGGMAAFIRYRYTRPNSRDVRLIAGATVAMVAILTVGAYALPQVTASSGGHSQQTSNGSPISSGSTTIKIATDLPVSGKDVSSGKPVEDGAHLAVMQANANHTIPGYTLVFDPQDDVGPSGLHDPTVGAGNVTALVSDALVAGIVGPFNSSVAKAEMPITNQAPLAQISPANTNPCLTRDTADSGCSGVSDLIPALRPTGKVNYFRIATTDDHQGPAGADYLYNTLNLPSTYVIDDAETYGIGIANAFIGEWKKLGGTVLGHSSEPSTTTSYVSLLTQIASTKPDVIYFGGIDSTGGTLIRQQMQQVPGLQNLPFVGGDGIVTPAFASTIGTSGGPVYGTVAVVDTSRNPNAQTFVQQYQAAFTDPINVYSAAAYDCANILIQAIKTALAKGVQTPRNGSDAAQAKVFRQAVIDAIQGIDFTGVTGHQSFDSNGDTTDKIITIYKLGLNAANKPDWIFASSVTVQ
jgi:branched-chain amino acid transport system substrate-binding protein